MTDANQPAGNETKVTKPSDKRRKRGIVIGVVAAVVIVAGAGFWVWHEQPSFCNAICHTPMDAYLDTYEQPLGQAGVDKWGLEVDDTSGMMAVTHRAAGLSCLKCHEPQLAEQISEGINWVGGNYEVVTNAAGQKVPTERTLADLTEARGIPSEQFCLNSGCHVNDDGSAMTVDDLRAKTEGHGYNPHAWHNGDMECGDCHKAHATSVNQCTECHAEAEVPAGWLTASQEKAHLRELSAAEAE